MAWTTPRTWVTAEVVTAALMNAHVRDNLNAIDALLDLSTGSFTDGGILVGSGSGVITALAVLADGRILVGDGVTDPVAFHLLTSSTGFVRHEAGGIEADISAIAKGGLVAGTGTGSMGIRTLGGSNGSILTRDDAESTGMVWSTASQAAIATGTYTGDGTTGQVVSVSGIDLSTHGLVMIFKRYTSNTGLAAGEGLISSPEIVDDNAAGAAIQIVDTAVSVLVDAIQALNNGSFTVDDNGTDADPNANGVAYNYIAIGVPT